jgi:hypothetical protein
MSLQLRFQWSIMSLQLRLQWSIMSLQLRLQWSIMSLQLQLQWSITESSSESLLVLKQMEGRRVNVRLRPI